MSSVESVRSRASIALAAFVAVVCLALTANAVFAAKPKRSKFVATATMNGAKVVSGGDVDATGDASLTFKKKKDRVCFSITYSKMNTATGGFLGDGAKREEGDVVVNLFSSSEPSPAKGCVRAPSKKTVQALEKTPKDFFVALTNSEHPKGAVRGQLRHTNNR